MSTEKKGAVVIVGAGPAGLTAASELAGAGRPVVVLERDPDYVGGLARTVRADGLRFDIGGHRFFSKNPEIEAWMAARLPKDLIDVPRLSRISYRGRFFDYPLRPMNALRGLGLATSLRCVASYLAARVRPIRSERSFADWVSNRFGRRLFEIFFRTYTEKVWGVSCDDLSADWAAQRIRGLSLGVAIRNALGLGGASGAKSLIESFKYPRLGPGMMWEKTRDDVVAAGGAVHLGRRVVSLRTEPGRVSVVVTETRSGVREEWRGEDFIVSMPLQETVLCLDPAPAPVVLEAARRLRYRDFLTVALVVEGENPFPDNWIYVHDPGVLLGRIQNFKNWSAAMVPGEGRTCLGLEYFCNEGDSLWSTSDADLVELGKRELTKLGLAGTGRITGGYVVRMEKAYPVYYHGYEEDVAVIKDALSGLPNLQVVGRNGMHKYNNQDHSMLTGLLAARNLLGGAFDVWRVNTDAEYQEERR